MSNKVFDQGLQDFKDKIADISFKRYSINLATEIANVVIVRAYCDKKTASNFVEEIAERNNLKTEENNKEWEGWEGQDRDNYTDDQDRENYTTD